MTTLINRIINHLADPAVWGVITAAFSAPDEQSLLRLYQKNPAAMQAMLMAELEQKLSQDPALAAQFAAILADDTPAQNWHIQGHNVGVVDARQANFQGAQNVNITGLQIQAPSPLPLSQGEKGNDSLAPRPHSGVKESAGVREDSLSPWERAGVRAQEVRARLATMSDDEIIIFCYDKAHHLYAKLPHNRATLRRELLAHLESKE